MDEVKINKEFKMECAQLIGEISSLAIMVNTFTNYCVFFEFSAHVEWFKVSVRESKKNYNNGLTEDEVQLNVEQWGDNAVASALQELIDLKSQLRKILLQKKIKYDGLRYTVREERDYHLIG